nr:37s ribosomal protein s19, mitochondrial [Quercus suber]
MEVRVTPQKQSDWSSGVAAYNGEAQVRHYSSKIPGTKRRRGHQSLDNSVFAQNASIKSAACALSVEGLPITRVAPGERVPPVRTQARSATILPNFVGLVFQVHNGKVYHDVRITEDMVGHKLGEFSPTRKRFTYKATKNR